MPYSLCRYYNCAIYIAVHSHGYWCFAAAITPAVTNADADGNHDADAQEADAEKPSLS